MDDDQEKLRNITVSDIQKQLAVDLLSLCTDGIICIMSQVDTTKSYSVELSFVKYMRINIFLCELIFREPERMIPLIDNALLIAQKYLKKSHHLQEHLIIKLHAKIRLSDLIICERSFVPRSSDVGNLVVFTGKVVRTGIVKVLETQRVFECQKCGMRFSMNYDREQYNIVPKPFHCASTECGGNKFKEVMLEIGENICRDYQEIRVQEDVSKLNMGNMPRSITVVLEDDLVDQCKAGDSVSVVGIVSRRWKNLVLNERCNVEIFLFANNILVHNRQFINDQLTDEMCEYFDNFWKKYENDRISGIYLFSHLGRNAILKMFCSRIWGMYPIKLAIMMILEGGISYGDASFRSNSHLLLVGDPGTGKSQFLKYVARLMPRSVQTTGIGSTSAGLTVAAVRDSNGWQLEAGALVLADRGICCIDEFNSMREHDKTSLHEAMEQQTISVAKAGLICQLQTRCSILASTNPKGKYDPYKEAEINIGVSSPLLSRFDLIFILMDTQNMERDDQVSTFLLNAELESSKDADTEDASWDLQKMQQFILYSKAKYQPEMSDEANQVLKEYYQFCRNSDSSVGPRTTIRLFESLIRLTQSHARLICKTVAQVEDAVTAIFIMEHSIHKRMLNQSWNVYNEIPSNSAEDYYALEEYILSKLDLLHLATKPTNEDLSTVDPIDARKSYTEPNCLADIREVENIREEVVELTSEHDIPLSSNLNSTRLQPLNHDNVFDDDLFIADLDFLE